MQILITQIFLIVQWLVVTTIVFAIVLMILRVIANYANLNPFGWASITIRRLTDPFINPVRRALIKVGVDQKYAPLITILLTVLIGWFVLQLAENIAGTLVGMIDGVQQHKPIRVVGHLLYGLLGLYSLLIFIRIIFGWGMVTYANRVMRFLVKTTEPLLGPLRRIVPPLGMMDISPIVAFIIIWLLQKAVAGTLLRL